MNGGRVQFEVSDGSNELLDHPWIRGHLEEIAHPSGNPTAAWISLVGVHDVDTAALIAAAPHAAWQAWCGPDTDTPGLWLGYHPSTGLVEADHLDGVIVVPLSTADPDHPAAAPHLRTLIGLTALLDAAWRREPPRGADVTGRQVGGVGGDPGVPLVSLADLGVTANRGPQWAEDDIEDALWGPHVIGWDDTHPDAPRIGAAIRGAADQLVDRITAGLPTGLRLVDDHIWGPPATDITALARDAVRWKERAGFAELVAQTGLWTPPRPRPRATAAHRRPGRPRRPRRADRLRARGTHRRPALGGVRDRPPRTGRLGRRLHRPRHRPTVRRPLAAPLHPRVHRPDRGPPPGGTGHW